MRGNKFIIIAITIQCNNIYFKLIVILRAI